MCSAVGEIAAIHRPPKLSIASAPPAVARSSPLALTFHATAGDQATNQIDLFRDGRPMRSTPLDKNGDATLAIDLVAGANRITAVAFDTSGLASKSSRTRPHQLRSGPVAASRYSGW